jgi:small subunit ribosomal protein S1
MNNVLYKPEGFLQIKDKNEGLSLSALEKAKNSGQILEARAVMCDNDHNLIVDFGDFRGIIPREDAAIGIKDGNIKDIAVLSRVNKSICFKVSEILKNNNETYILLSRLKAQEEALEYMLHYYTPGDVIDAKITHLEPFGAFADIGCGIIGLISIENISVSRISHPKDRFYAGQNIKVVIKDIDFAQKRFTLSHKELLGTWQENAA